MKRKTLSLKKNFGSETEIEDIYATFDADDLEFLENKALAESFESLRQVTSVVNVEINKVEAQHGDLALKDTTPSGSAVLAGTTKEIVVSESQLENLPVEAEVTVRKILSLNIPEKSENKTAIEKHGLEKEPVIIERPSRKYTVISISPKNAPSTFPSPENTNINVEQERPKVDRELDFNANNIITKQVCDDVNVVADINSNDFAEQFEQDFSTDNLLIDEHFDDEAEDSFKGDWDDDNYEDNLNVHDTSLDFLTDIDLEEIIDISESSFLGLLNDNSDELVSFSQRAKQAANVVSQEFNLSKACFDKLSDIFLHNGWGPCRVAIIKQLDSGRSMNEIWNAHQIREIWRSKQDIWQLGRTIPAKFDQLRVKQRKALDARKGLLEIEKLLNCNDELPTSSHIKYSVKENIVVKVKKKQSNTMAWTLALRLVDFLDIQTVDSDFVSEFFCYIHQDWLDLIKSYRNPIRFEIYLHHHLSELSTSWRKPAPLPHEELWWNDTPTYSEDPYQFDCLMGRCYGEITNDYMDIKEQFNEL